MDNQKTRTREVQELLFSMAEGFAEAIEGRTDDRPYKKPKTIKQAFDIIDEEAEFGKLDKELIKIAKELYLKEE